MSTASLVSLVSLVDRSSLILLFSLVYGAKYSLVMITGFKREFLSSSPPLPLVGEGESFGSNNESKEEGREFFHSLFPKEDASPLSPLRVRVFHTPHNSHISFLSFFSHHHCFVVLFNQSFSFSLSLQVWLLKFFSQKVRCLSLLVWRRNLLQVSLTRGQKLPPKWLCMLSVSDTEEERQRKKVI